MANETWAMNKINSISLHLPSSEAPTNPARCGSPVTSSFRRWPFHPCMNTNSYLRLLLMVLTICLLGFAGCASIDPPAGKNQTGDYVTIGPAAHNSESQSFDPPWPFGCLPGDRPTYQRSTNCL